MYSRNRWTWLPGIVLERIGKVMYNVRLDNGKLERSHVNQIQSRITTVAMDTLSNDKQYTERTARRLELASSYGTGNCTDASQFTFLGAWSFGFAAILNTEHSCPSTSFIVKSSTGVLVDSKLNLNLSVVKLFWFSGVRVRHRANSGTSTSSFLSSEKTADSVRPVPAVLREEMLGH